MNTPDPSPAPLPHSELPWHPITEVEIERSLKAIKCATKTTIALNGLRHLRPEQLRQLYQACVMPVVDYASV